jgi:hypothetical protein
VSIFATLAAEPPPSIPQNGGEILGYIIVMILTGGFFTGLQALRKLWRDFKDGKIKDRRDVLEINGAVASSTIELLQDQMVRQDQWHQQEVASIQSRLNEVIAREQRLERLVRIYEDNLDRNGIRISAEIREEEGL